MHITGTGLVGIDLSIKQLATLSRGEVFENKRPYKYYSRNLTYLPMTFSVLPSSNYMFRHRQNALRKETAHY